MSESTTGHVETPRTNIETKSTAHLLSGADEIIARVITERPWVSEESLVDKERLFKEQCRKSGKPYPLLIGEYTRNFSNRASEEKQNELEEIESEIVRLQEILKEKEGIVRTSLARYPCLTHVSNPEHIDNILQHGLRPVGETNNGKYDAYDKKFPTLGLRNVVHCGWGGIDQFSIQIPEHSVVFLLDNSIVTPDNKVTMRDWSRWGPIQIGRRGGGSDAAEQVVKEFQEKLETANAFAMNPYQRVTSLEKFMREGYDSQPGFVSIPTLLLPSIAREGIKGMILGDTILGQNPDIGQLTSEIPTFRWDELTEADLPYGHERQFEFATLSHRARFAESKITGSEETFLETLSGREESAASQMFEIEKRLLLLKGIKIGLLESEISYVL